MSAPLIPAAQRTAEAAVVLQSLVLRIVKALVDVPDKVSVEVISGTSQVILIVNTEPKDVGKVIGRLGVNADAIRRLLHAAAGKLSVRAVLEISEDPRTTSSPP